jgi:uncharacterized protein
MRTVITGATGLIGRELVRRSEGAVVVLSRDPDCARRRLGSVEAHGWDPESGLVPAAALRGAEAVFHLAGEPVAAGRWTEARKRRIRDSRVVGTRNLVAGLAEQALRPRVLVSASAVGYYGDRGDEPLDESAPRGQGFLAEVCADWEREAMAAESLGIRVVCVRIGMVLAPGEGALARMLPPFRLGVGGRIGNGRQWVPWIHVQDVVGILRHASLNDRIRGPMNAVAPGVVRNAEFAHALGRAVRRPAFLPLPAMALRLALGEMSQIATASQQVKPRVAERTGYSFQFAEIGRALSAVVSTADPSGAP